MVNNNRHSETTYSKLDVRPVLLYARNTSIPSFRVKFLSLGNHGPNLSPPVVNDLAGALISAPRNEPAFPSSTFILPPPIGAPKGGIEGRSTGCTGMVYWISSSSRTVFRFLINAVLLAHRPPQSCQFGLSGKE
jgi:hypothetical protein